MVFPTRQSQIHLELASIIPQGQQFFILFIYFYLLRTDEGKLQAVPIGHEEDPHHSPHGIKVAAYVTLIPWGNGCSWQPKLLTVFHYIYHWTFAQYSPSCLQWAPDSEDTACVGLQQDPQADSGLSPAVIDDQTNGASEGYFKGWVTKILPWNRN